MTEPITIELPDMVGGTVAVVTLNPGDTLVLSSPRHLPYHVLEGLKDTVERVLPGVLCMVLDDGLCIGGIIRRDGE